MKVLFTARYDHKWPSRAVTCFPEGWSGRVKREVAAAAIAKGKATEMKSRVKSPLDGANTDMGGGQRVAEPHDAHDVGGFVRDPLLDGAGE